MLKARVRKMGWAGQTGGVVLALAVSVVPVWASHGDGYGQDPYAPTHGADYYPCGGHNDPYGGHHDGHYNPCDDGYGDHGGHGGYEHHHPQFPGQCSDGIDNDSDGKIDALIELPWHNGESRSWSRDPFGLRNFVNANAREFGYNTIPSSTALFFDAPTAQFVCHIAGFATVSHQDCVSNYDGGRCGWHSPHDDTLSRWIPSSYRWHVGNAKDMGNRWLTTLTCTHRLSDCSDGKDNDWDGKTDYPEDRGCASPYDTSEKPHDPKCGRNPYAETEFEECRNGKDDDGDGLRDRGDPGCREHPDLPGSYNPNLDDERSGTSQCQDGIDNDKDGAIDLDDGSCLSETDDDERFPIPECSDGGDNDDDDLYDAQDPGCFDDRYDSRTFNPQLNNERAATSACQDGIDNDWDGWTDIQDDDCWRNRHDPQSHDKRSEGELYGRYYPPGGPGYPPGHPPGRPPGHRPPKHDGGMGPDRDGGNGEEDASITDPTTPGEDPRLVGGGCNASGAGQRPFEGGLLLIGMVLFEIRRRNRPRT